MLGLYQLCSRLIATKEEDSDMLQLIEVSAAVERGEENGNAHCQITVRFYSRRLMKHVIELVHLLAAPLFYVHEIMMGIWRGTLDPPTAVCLLPYWPNLVVGLDRRLPALLGATHGVLREEVRRLPSPHAAESCATISSVGCIMSFEQQGIRTDSAFYALTAVVYRSSMDVQTSSATSRRCQPCARSRGD